MNDEKCLIQFTVNGKDGRVAFEFDKSELNDQALFPHLATKNFGYKVNFGKAAENFWVKRRESVKVNLVHLFIRVKI